MGKKKKKKKKSSSSSSASCSSDSSGKEREKRASRRRIRALEKQVKSLQTRSDSFSPTSGSQFSGYTCANAGFSPQPWPGPVEAQQRGTPQLMDTWPPSATASPT